MLSLGFGAAVLNVSMPRYKDTKGKLINWLMAAITRLISRINIIQFKTDLKSFSPQLRVVAL